MTAVSPQELARAGNVRYAVLSATDWRVALTISRRTAEQLPSATLGPISWFLQETFTSKALVLQDRSSSPAALELLSCSYHIDGAEELAELLTRWPDLASLVLEAQPHLVEHFGLQTGLALEPTRDPEVPTDERVVVTIRTDLEPENALNRLSAFYDAWWFGAMDQAHGRLVFNVELL